MFIQLFWDAALPLNGEKFYELHLCSLCFVVFSFLCGINFRKLMTVTFLCRICLLNTIHVHLPSSSSPGTVPADESALF